jgi:hypothetical protein
MDAHNSPKVLRSGAAMEEKSQERAVRSWRRWRLPGDMAEVPEGKEEKPGDGFKGYG